MEIVGVNGIGEEEHNGNIAQMLNVLAWTQDTAAQDVWRRWAITYRDLLILDGFNRPIARDNLTSHDLGVAQNYEAVKKALLTIATPADTDKDGLPDDWEYAWFGKLDPTPDGDADGDGYTNFEEFAFSSSPIDPTSKPVLVPFINRPAGNPALGVAFRRFLGSSVDFVAETSPDLVHWSAETTNIRRTLAPQNLFDGVGGGETRFQQTTAAGAAANGFIRVRPIRRLGN